LVLGAFDYRADFERKTPENNARFVPGESKSLTLSEIHQA